MRTIFLLAIAFSFMAEASAQEARFVDLTTIRQRIELRTTPIPEQTSVSPQSSGVGGFSSGVLIGDCGVGANEPRALRTTVTWLDRLSYKDGDAMEWEVKIENAGTVPVRLAVSPDLSDLQPRDASEKFSYEETGVRLLIRTESGTVNLAHVSLYGAESLPGSLMNLQVGEWLRLRARSDVKVSNDDAVQSMRGEALAGFWLHHGKVTPSPGGYGTALMNECIKAFEGVGFPIVIAGNGK